MSPLTPALTSYWQRLRAEPLAARRTSLDTTRERVRSGREPAAALVPIALCDTDEGVVAAATAAYVRAAPGTAAVADAVDWIRRGLALNRGAVFGALLTLDDPATTERLAALRLLLSAVEVEVVCRVLGRSPIPTAQAFLRDWAELVADGPLQREWQVLQAATGDERRLPGDSTSPRASWVLASNCLGKVVERRSQGMGLATAGRIDHETAGLGL